MLHRRLTITGSTRVIVVISVCAQLEGTFVRRSAIRPLRRAIKHRNSVTDDCNSVTDDLSSCGASRQSIQHSITASKLKEKKMHFNWVHQSISHNVSVSEASFIQKVGIFASRVLREAMLKHSVSKTWHS